MYPIDFRTELEYDMIRIIGSNLSFMLKVPIHYQFTILKGTKFYRR